MTIWDFAHAHFVGLAVLLVVLLVFLDSTIVNWMRARLVRDLTKKHGK